MRSTHEKQMRWYNTRHLPLHLCRLALAQYTDVQQVDGTHTLDTLNDVTEYLVYKITCTNTWPPT